MANDVRRVSKGHMGAMINCGFQPIPRDGLSYGISDDQGSMFSFALFRRNYRPNEWQFWVLLPFCARRDGHNRNAWLRYELRLFLALSRRKEEWHKLAALRRLAEGRETTDVAAGSL
jgi:hypothetical protein